MNRRIRGAAYVSVVWLVVMIVLVLAAAGVAYMISSDSAKKDETIAALTREKADATTRYESARQKVRDLSKVVGYRDENDPASESNPQQINDLIKQLHEQYSKDGEVGVDATTTARVIDALRTRVDDLKRERDEARGQATTAETARTSLQANLADVTRQKDEAAAMLQKQLQDERDRNASQEQADKTHIEDLNKRLADAESRAKTEKDDLEKRLGASEGEMRKREARIAELGKKVEFIKQPDQPDGSVIQVSTANTCYIDLGTRDLLRRGTRFKVFTYGKGGEMRDKGMIEVTSVNDSMAEATVVDLKDRFDPIARGDKIAAPNYDPKMPREFVLTGRFPTGYSRAMVKDRLIALGAKVADHVGPNTDFLVVGDREDAVAPSADASATEGGTPAEDAGDSEEMKKAQLYRVQILPVREILDYLKYE